MTTKTLPDKRIHRASLSGGATCKAQGRVRISTSGLGVTCTDCQPITDGGHWYIASCRGCHKARGVNRDGYCESCLAMQHA